MVGRLLLLKILHCKRLRKKQGAKNNPSVADTSVQRDHSIKTEKREQNEMICRVCLKEGSISIYSKDTESMDEFLYTFAGIEVRDDDSYPKFLCQSCNALLQGAILLRKTAQESDALLRQSPTETISIHNEAVDYNDDDNIDNNSSSSDKPEEKIKYHCIRCDIEFETLNEYRAHRLTEEHDNKRILCTICNKSYNAMYYKRHVARHEIGVLPRFICDVCGKEFNLQGHFSRHRLTHFYKLPFKCSLCPYKGRFSESLKLHMRKHTGEKPYQCAQCSACFISKSNLNKHMWTHRSDHDFKCESCGRGFFTKRDLLLHFKVEHSGIKDHVCNICGKAFGYRKQMMKHQLKVHKRDKLPSGRMPLYLKVQSMKEKGELIAES